MFIEMFMKFEKKIHIWSEFPRLEGFQMHPILSSHISIVTYNMKVCC